MFTTISMAAAVKQLFEYFGGGDFPDTVEQHITEHNIDINNVSQENYSPLMAASKNGRERTVRKLIDLGAQVNATTDGGTALIEAAYENQLEVMLVLIEKGADVNFVDQEGYTALMWATHEGHIEAVTLLIKAGANVNYINEEGETSLDLAIANKHLSVARKIANSGGKSAQVLKKHTNGSSNKGDKGAGKKVQVADDSDEESDESDEDDDAEDGEGEDGGAKVGGAVKGGKGGAAVEEVEIAADEEEDEEEEEEPEETWLTPILTEAGTPAHLISLADSMLVRQEGFGSANTLARVPPSLFHRAYLEGLDIKGLGLQQTLLDLHADLHHEFVQQKRQSSNSKPHTSSGTTRANKDVRSGESRASEGRAGVGTSSSKSTSHPLHSDDPLYDAADAREQVRILWERAREQKEQKEQKIAARERKERVGDGPSTHTRFSTRSTAEEARSDNEPPEQQRSSKQKEHKEAISQPRVSASGIAQLQEKEKERGVTQEKDSGVKDGAPKASKKRSSAEAASEEVDSETAPAKKQSGAARDAAVEVE